MYSLDNLNDDTKQSLLKEIIDDPMLDRKGFLNRIATSIETNGINFTAIEAYNLPIELVKAISEDLKLATKDKK